MLDGLVDGGAARAKVDKGVSKFLAKLGVNEHPALDAILRVASTVPTSGCVEGNTDLCDKRLVQKRRLAVLSFLKTHGARLYISGRSSAERWP